MNESDLVGTWTLRSWHTSVGEREVAAPVGESPSGQLIYTEQGTMSAVIVRRDRSVFAGPHFSSADEAEQARAARGCISYAGTWQLQANRVIHRVRYSLFPNWIGEDLIREAQLTGKILTLSASDHHTRSGEPVTHRIVWHRLD